MSSLDRWKELRSQFLEEAANTITHGLGLGLAIAGLVVIVVVATRGGARTVVACSVYGAMLVLNYLASTLYHSVKYKGPKKLFRILDHCAIYLLIAGTYTPFTLVCLKGGWGWSIFGVIWGLALAGILFKVFFIGRFAIMSALVYLAMGWLIVIATKPLIGSIPVWGLIWLGAGGLAYTGGILFFAFDTKVRYFHAVWHIFVLAGSIFHYFAVIVSIMHPALGHD